MHTYKCNILKVIDGDTVDVDIDLGFGVWMRKERIRILGIDTPESRTRDKIEKIFGFDKLRGYDTTRLYAYLSERYLSFWFKKYTKFKTHPWVFLDF